MNRYFGCLLLVLSDFYWRMHYLVYSSKIMEKWEYIKLLSDISDRYGDKLLLLLERYNKNNLQEITFEEVKEFYEKLTIK